MQTAVFEKAAETPVVAKTRVRPKAVDLQHAPMGLKKFLCALDWRN